jgi:adenylate kinase family enzyme
LIAIQLRVDERDAGAGEPRLFACDPAIREWLCGGDGVDPELVEVARVQPALAPLASWPTAEVLALVERTLASDGGRLRLRIAGLPGSGRRTLAATVSARLGLTLLAIDSDAVDDSSWPRLFLRAQRQAFLGRTALAWTGERAARRWPRVADCFPLQFLVGETVPEPAPPLIDHLFELPVPSLVEREALWRGHLPAAASWPERRFQLLVSQHRATPGDIAAVARAGASTVDEATSLVRSAARHRLGELAEPLPCTFAWDDLVVPSGLREALGDFVFEAGARARFWEAPAAQRLFPQGRGLMALFTGPPGTGKTMAAQVIAASLGVDLFRIDLSSVVSKWVGETSRNLERVLGRAAKMDVVLLFDEADALFGRRTDIHDAHDRFANTDTNYLLQAIESYSGVAVLATNRRNNIDPAFTRRLRYVLEFPLPEAAERAQIWTRLIGELAGAGRLRVLLPAIELLAGAIELTGAQVKQSLLTALFAAGRDGEPLGARQLCRGIERELLKEGRALDGRVRDRLVGHGRD